MNILLCKISRSYLCKLFKKECGITIKEYVTFVRIGTAKKLLKGTSYSISDIQESVGYKSRTHFFNTFKNITGLSQLKFRNNEFNWEFENTSDSNCSMLTLNINETIDDNFVQLSELQDILP